MEADATSCKSRGTLCSPWRVFILYWLPANAIVGPFFLLMALVALSYGVGILRLGGNGWNLLGLITLVGAIALWYLPEMFLGKYLEGHAGDGNQL